MLCTSFENIWTSEIDVIKNEILRGFGLRCVSDEYLVLHQAQVILCHKIKWYHFCSIGRRVPLIVFHLIAGIPLFATIFIPVTTGKSSLAKPLTLDTLRPVQNDRRLANSILKGIFMTESIYIFIEILLQFVHMDKFVNKSVWVQLKAWRRSGDKPLPGPMLTKFPDLRWCHFTTMSSE